MQEGAKYPLNNTGLGHAEHFAGLSLPGFEFGGRRSKLCHEAGALVLGERSLKRAGERLLRDPRSCCALSWRSLPGGSWGQSTRLGRSC